jgi:enamine deaminase RidA (YjgF/YER057c/UK114 family)
VSKKQRNPGTVHPPVGFYTHQVEVDGSARWLAISGQVGRTPDGQVPDDPIEQLKLALENIRRNLEAAGLAIDDIVKINWYLVGDIDAAARREVVGAWLGGHTPASTLVYVARLVSPEYKVEVEAWACRA